jgi:hypothetical protein
MQVLSTTNEPARCATLLPVLAQLPQPLALVESAPRLDCACCRIITATITDTRSSERDSDLPLRRQRRRADSGRAAAYRLARRARPQSADIDDSSQVAWSRPWFGRR